MSKFFSFMFYIFIFSNISISIPGNSKSDDSISKKKKWAEVALEKKPKSLFLLKKASEDLDIEEPSINFLTRQTATVINDKRLDNLD